MERTKNRPRKRRLIILLFLAGSIPVVMLLRAAMTKNLPLISNETEIGVYYTEGEMPGFQRELPLAEDDPFGSEEGSKDAEIPCRFGLVYDDVNDARVFDAGTGSWTGSVPTEDSGWLIGGNARSATDEQELDSETNDFAALLPNASLYVPWNSVSFDKGTIEYSFYTEDFNYNAFPVYDPVNVTVKKTVAGTTRYTQLFSDAWTLPASGEYRTRSWSGVIYTGGIKKTTVDENGEPVVTSVSNPNNKRGLFAVRFAGAVQDRYGNWLDLVLTFTRITFVAEADVTGPLQIMEGNKLYLSPILCDDGQYLINLNGEPDPAGDPLQSEGVRIGAKYEITYSIENKWGIPADGLLLYSNRGLDHPSMAMSLDNGADWGLNELGIDYRWAEGIGFVSGAASYAVSPYYNHNAGEETELLHVSRMKDVPADGTANGLMFTAGSALSTREEARRDGGTFDTGFAVLLRSRGSMIVTLSADRRENMDLTLFAPNISNQIIQRSTKGGRISTRVCSLDTGTLTEYRDSIIIAAVGDTTEHLIRANRGFVLKTIQIDANTIDVAGLQWTAGDNGTEKAVSNDNGTEYFFLRDEDGTVHYWFRDVNGSHKIHAGFATKLFDISGDSFTVGNKKRVLLTSLAFAIVFCADILWMIKKKGKRSRGA
ncbi:MAG: hypothetical protein IJT62_03595 [Oscillospiraceae bacterium]|nr:hypothetical protein [Oscillospiraceae bacterium]